MFTIPSKSCRSTSLTKAVAHAAIAMALAGGALAHEHGTSAPLRPHLARVSLTDLEQAFWSCDYVATVHGAGGGEFVACAAIYDALKERKFDGNFEQLVAWWKRNKPAEFARLGALERPSVNHRGRRNLGAYSPN